MFGTNANAIMGERACTALELFRRGCATMRRTPAEMSSSEKIYGISSHNEGGLPRERSRRGKANSKSASALLLELQEHVKGKCHLTHGLKGLEVDNFLHGTECSNATAMSSASWCIVRRNGYHWTVELLRYAFFSYTAIMNFTAGVAGAFGALHHMSKAWRKQEKKSVGSWFVAESASPFGGELS